MTVFDRLFSRRGAAELKHGRETGVDMGARVETGDAGVGRAAKSLPSGFLAITQPSSATWGARTYRTLARDGVMRNAVVYRCVRLIAEAAASVPLRVDGVPSTPEFDPHPVSELLARPTHGMTLTDILETWYGYLLVSGNAYLRAHGVGPRLAGLQVLRPDRVRVVPHGSGGADRFDYLDDDRWRLIPGEAVDGVGSVLHLRLFHPLDDCYGLSPIEAAATAIDIHNGASRWNKALLDNAARPSGALVYSNPTHMTGEQFDRLKAELEESFQGARNAGRPLLLEGGLDWKAMSLTPRDMDFIAAKDAAAREIALALGVPPMLLGIPGDNTYANYQEANRTFWRQTVLPLVMRTARALAAWLGPAYDRPFILRPDLEGVDALSSERDALWQRLQAVSFLDENEKRAMVGYPPRDSQASRGPER
ncbi:MAG: phage portal protein [Hyphomicrobiaceae bacterium]